MNKLTSHPIALFITPLLYGEGSGEAFGTLISVLFVLAVLIGLFFLLRTLMLWYWKVDVIVENQTKQIYEQQRTNYLLELQNELLTKRLPKDNEDLTRI